MKAFDFSKAGDKARMARIAQANPKEFAAKKPLFSLAVGHAIEDLFGKQSDNDRFVISEEGAAYLKSIDQAVL